MKKSLVILLAATLGLAACNREKKGPGGLLYTIHHTENKAKIKEGDIVKMNFIRKNDKDSVIMSTFDMGQAQIFPVQKKTYPGDMNDVLTLFGEGDSATFKINVDTLLAKSQPPQKERPAELKNEKYLTFTVKIEKVFSKNPGEADSTFNKRAGEFFQKDYKETTDKLKAAEPAKIKNYIADKGLKTKTSASGLHYIINAPGDATRPVNGDTVEVNYTGSTAVKKDGKYKVFDTSDEKTAKENKLTQPGRTYGPTKMVYGGTVPGFTEALSLIGKGGKITVIIPSALGYGDQGIPQIGIAPYSPLVFDIEVKNIIKGKAPVAAPAAPVAAPAKK